MKWWREKWKWNINRKWKWKIIWNERNENEIIMK